MQRSNERTKEFGQAGIAVRREELMNGNVVHRAVEKSRVILPVILRITFCLLMWTLGVMAMSIAEAQTREQRVAQKIPVDRARVENLQRWVDAGHDTWCRDPQAVAAMALRRIAPEFANYDFELASLTTGNEKVSSTKAVYVFHSIDGHTSYRITLRRFRWQSKTASSPNELIWIPVRSEKITRESFD
jgi:chloramphenicol 3-O-phosphotransferase